MKTPAKKTTHVHKLEVPLENHPVTDAKAEPAPSNDTKDAPETDEDRALRARAPGRIEPLTEDEKAHLRANPVPPEGTPTREMFPALFGGKGDHDKDGKPGGDIKAQPKEPRPMPANFKVETVREGNTVVARQDGIEVPFRFTDDKDEYAEREKAQREAMWAALEARRIKAL
jgi:hypothetical protein